MTALSDCLFAVSEREAAIDALHAATAIYTREPVVDELLLAVRWPAGARKLVDPSCGDGMFLWRALTRLLDEQPHLGAAELCQRLEGWELHPTAAIHSRQRLAAELIQRGRPPEMADDVACRMVRNADFLIDGPREPYCDVIAGNPPYLRAANVPPLLRADYTSIVPAYAAGDMLHCFLDRAADALLPGGEIALVTADRWLFNVGAAKLRASLGQRLAIDELRRLDAATTFYRPKDRRAGTPPRVHPVAVVLRAPREDSIRLTGAPVFPDNLAAAPHSGGPTLDSVATVWLAPWLGTKGIFVVDEAAAATLPPDHLVPAIDTDDIRNGVLGKPTRYAIRTSPDVEPPPAIMAHLRQQLSRMANRGRRAKSPWVPPETWHKRSLDAPILLVPRIARTLRAIRIPAGVLPINHNLSVVTADPDRLDRIEALLSSEEATAWMQAHAPRLENGFHSLTPTLLRQLPMNGMV